MFSDSPGFRSIDQAIIKMTNIRNFFFLNTISCLISVNVSKISVTIMRECNRR